MRGDDGSCIRVAVSVGCFPGMVRVAENLGKSFGLKVEQDRWD